MEILYRKDRSQGLQNIYQSPLPIRGPGSSVGIATGYGLDGPGIESRWRRNFPHLSRPAVGPTQPPVQWVPGFFPGAKERPGRDADPSPRSSAVVTKGQSYTSTPPTGRTACTEPRCLYKGALYLYLYTPYSKVSDKALTLTFRHRASSVQDMHFATLQRTLFIYLINKYISLTDICLTVHH